MSASSETASVVAPRDQRTPRGTTRRFATGLARAVGGAVIFAIPLLMTMEMWALGFTLEPLRLALFLALGLPLLVGLAGDAYRDPALLLPAYRTAMLGCAAMLALGGLLALVGLPGRPRTPDAPGPPVTPG